MQEPLMTHLYNLDYQDPCEEGWDALLKHLGKPSKGFETLLKVSEIGKLGNLGWLCWTFCLFKDARFQCQHRRVYNKAARMVYVEFGVWCAERVRHLLTDDISIKALDVSREYLAGTATLEELKEAATMAYVNNADTVSMHDLEAHSPAQRGQHYAAFSVAMASTSLAFRSQAFESAAYHAAMAVSFPFPEAYEPEAYDPEAYEPEAYDPEAYEKERSIQLAKLMELLDRGVRNEAPSNLPNETGHEL